MARELAATKPSNPGKLSLYLGLAAGVVAAILVALVLTGSDNDKSTTPTEAAPAIRYAVVASRDIPARTRLTSDMLKVSTFKVQDVSPDAFTTAAQLTDRVTAADIAAGQLFLPSLVSATPGQNLNFTVSPGMRAISISVREVTTAGGNIVPGNQVDLIGMYHLTRGAEVNQIIALLTGNPPAIPLPPAPDGALLTLTVLQNVKILAVAQDLPNQPVATGQGGNQPAPKENINPKAGTVTLEVTPQQALILALSDSIGAMRLSLRPFGETTPALANPFVTTLGN